MPRLLLHVCCGPCGIYPLIKLSANYEVAVFYYNPNIHPVEEYAKRKKAARDYCQKNNIHFIETEYQPQEYFTAVKGKEKDQTHRCPCCYELRLTKTAQYAALNNFDFFSSTLLISPHQDIELIKIIGERLAKEFHLHFYTAENKDSKKKYKGFRPGFTAGRIIAKKENMYRQNYCGCIFSQNGL